MPVLYKLFFIKSQVRCLLGDLDGGIILKGIMEKQGTKMWTELYWLRMGFSVGFL
jgi:hypothetical protein